MLGLYGSDRLLYNGRSVLAFGIREYMTHT
jgi:hypothetical protein